jgi:tripartite ATP-independent transporter DctM subunit
MTGGEVGLLMLGLFILTILLGFPIFVTLMAMGVFFGYYAYATPDQLQHIFSNRIFDLLVQNTFSIVSNDVLTAVPLFLFMGYVVERANILDRLFFSIQVAARRIPGSLAVATLITCALFATATGIVGAVVTLMGLLAFPAMLKAGYDTKLSAGVICAGGTLGILIPPSILLIVYAATAGESVVRLYAGAFFPGFVLAGFYILYVVGRAILNPKLAPKLPEDQADIPSRQVILALLTSFFPLAFLIMAVLGAIVLGLATPTEAAAVGAFGSLVLAAGYRELDFPRLKEAVFLTARTTAMVTFLFVGSWTFASVFAYLGGQGLVEEMIKGLNINRVEFLLLAQFIIFLLGWPLEWTEIIIIFVPIFLPLVKFFDVDPLVFGILVALNIQTSFNTPPMAMSAYYLKGVAPPHVQLTQIFGGALPFVFMVFMTMALLYVFPELATWLPNAIYAAR